MWLSHLQVKLVGSILSLVGAMYLFFYNLAGGSERVDAFLSFWLYMDEPERTLTISQETGVFWLEPIIPSWATFSLYILVGVPFLLFAFTFNDLHRAYGHRGPAEAIRITLKALCLMVLCLASALVVFLAIDPSTPSRHEVALFGLLITMTFMTEFVALYLFCEDVRYERYRRCWRQFRSRTRRPGQQQ
jgi:hypothetical protein